MVKFNLSQNSKIEVGKYYKDLTNSGGDVNAKNMGLIKTQGKDYKVRDGDVILFRFNV